MLHFVSYSLHPDNFDIRDTGGGGFEAREMGVVGGDERSEWATEGREEEEKGEEEEEDDDDGKEGEKGWTAK